MVTAESIKTLARSLGADIAGIAAAAAFTGSPPETHPSAVLPSAKSVVVAGCAFPREILDADKPAYTALRNSASEKVSAIAQNISDKLIAAGHETVPVAALVVKGVINGRYSGPLSLKHAAALAGLGYIGKNTLLITPELGNMVWFSAVVTAAQLEADAPPTGTQCPDDCALCIDACPVAALGEPAMKQPLCGKHAFPVIDGKLEIQCWECRKVCPRAFGFAPSGA